MQPCGSPSVRNLQTLQAELGALQAGHRAQLGRLEQVLARAQAERAEAQAEAGQQATVATRLRQELARLQAKLRRGQELCAQYQLEAKALHAKAQLKETQHCNASAEVARLQDELDRLRAQRKALNEKYWELWQCHHHICHHPDVPRHRSPETLLGLSTEDADLQWLEGTPSQDTTGSFVPFLLFVVAATIIFLYPYLRDR